MKLCYSVNLLELFTQVSQRSLPKYYSSEVSNNCDIDTKQMTDIAECCETGFKNYIEHNSADIASMSCILQAL